MTCESRPFGVLPDGSAVEAITIGRADGLQAEILTFGGTLRRLSLPVRGLRRELILTLPDLDAYVRDRSYIGVLVGRVANRIAGASFVLAGTRHKLAANEGVNQLHGGMLGFGKRLWRVRESSAEHDSLTLELHSPDGEEGYPGDLDVRATFSVAGDELRLQFDAQFRETMPLNLTYHPYFNLSGDPGTSVATHTLRMPAAAYLPVGDSQLLPTGEIAAVAGTPFDFRRARALAMAGDAGHPQLAPASGFDHCWVLDADRDCDAELHSPDSGITMTIHSDRPGLQFYAGQGLPGQHPGMNGLCLEPQDFPDAVNKPEFPSIIAQPGTAWRSVFRYGFTR